MMCYNLLKDNIRDAATRRVFHIGATVRAANPLRVFIMRTPTGIPANESVFKFDIHAVGLTTRKRRGEAAEAAFLAKASGLGFGVAKPWGDSERYDFLLDSGHGHFWRVQVKSTQRYAESALSRQSRRMEGHLHSRRNRFPRRLD